MLRKITVAAEPFDGFQMRAYRLRDTPEEPGVPLTRIEPRALLVPPGFPDFMSRRRVVKSGPVRIEGRAWSGWAPVSMVEVSIDGGDTWEPADLELTQVPDSWARWTWMWQSELGSYVLSCRATDASGRTQPLGQRWSRGGVRQQHHPTSPGHCCQLGNVTDDALAGGDWTSEPGPGGNFAIAWRHLESQISGRRGAVGIRAASRDESRRRSEVLDRRSVRKSVFTFRRDG